MVGIISLKILYTIYMQNRESYIIVRFDLYLLQRVSFAAVQNHAQTGCRVVQLFV